MKMRNIFRATLALAAMALASSAFTACSDDETYADLLLMNYAELRNAQMC